MSTPERTLTMPTETASEGVQRPPAAGAPAAPPAPNKPATEPRTAWLSKLCAEVADVGTLTRAGGRYTLTLAGGREVCTRSSKVVREEARKARPKSKGGRPFLAPGEETKSLNLRLPASLLEALKKEAAEVGLQLSEHARKKLRRGLR